MTQENELHERLEKEAAENHAERGVKRLIERLTKKVVAIVLVLLLLILAGAAAVWFFVLKGDDNDSFKKIVPPPQVKAAREITPVDESQIFKDIVFLETFKRLELKPSGNIKLITLDIALELLDPGMKQEIEKSRLSIRKVIEAEIRERTWLVLRTPEGKLQLKLGLVKKINQTLTRAKIRDLYFITLIMQ